MLPSTDTRLGAIERRSWSLRRITSGSSWIPEIDGLRFVAIVLVVLFHLSAEVTTKSGTHFATRSWYEGLFGFFGRGDIGVRIFFVISGFILGRPFARHYLLGQPKPSLRSYYLRRLTRLEPPYLINIAICAASIVLYARVPISEVLPHFAASAVYLHGFLFGRAGVINPVAWTLEMEVQFYLLVPLLTLIFVVRNRWFRRVLLGAICIAIPAALESFVFGQVGESSRFWASICWWLQYFLAGILLSDLYVTDMSSWEKSWWWDLASGIAWCILLLTNHFLLYSLEPLLIVLAFVGAFRGIWLHRLFTIESLAIIGGMCYSIYLWHFYIIALIFKVSRRVLVTHDLLTNFLVQSVLILPCVLAVSVAYFIAIERPCMDPGWPHKLRAALSSRVRRPRAA
ncbi:MAG TPA: acyltransferase, partial [Acidobacteriaceae bacterium]